MMQKRIVAALLFSMVLTVFSCSKDAGTTGNPALQGTWELSSRSGGIAGVQVDYPRGNGTLYVFTQNTYKQIIPGQETTSGPYQVKQDSSYLFQRPVKKIFFNGRQDNHSQLLEVTLTRLTLTDDANDGFTYEYHKVLED